MNDDNGQERGPDGRFLPGHSLSGRGGRLPRKQEEQYRLSILNQCSPEKFAEIIGQAAEDALGDSWKCRNAARNFLINVLSRTGVLGSLVGTQTNIGIFANSEDLQAAIANRLQELMGQQLPVEGGEQPGVVEAEAEVVTNV